jgi:hypothetical protein
VTVQSSGSKVGCTAIEGALVVGTSEGVFLHIYDGRDFIPDIWKLVSLHQAHPSH